jgi:tripartite-type tricarboxylate transporter receptor subunit TctC
MKGFLLAVAAACALFAPAASPADYPSKPVRILVGFAPGGGVDITARIVAQKLSERWGKPVVVENRAGAAGNIATAAVAKSAPDGATLLMAFSSHASNPALYPDLPFDVTKDFSAITLVATAPVVVAVGAQVPAKSLAELIALARSRPGEIKFASSGVGTPVHLGGELFMQLTGVRITHVPYKGIAPAMAAMLGGETELTFPAVLSGMAHFRSGRLRPLAIAGHSRYPALPDVPTAAEAGLAGFEIDYWYGLFGPAGLPAAIVQQVQRDVAAAITTPEMKESLLAQGSIAVAGTPEALDRRVRDEVALWTRVVKAGNVKAE